MAGTRIGAGYRYLFYGVMGASGYLIGNTADGATAGDQDGQPMQRLRGAQTIPVNTPDSQVVTVMGDDGPMTTFDFGPDGLPTGVFEQAVRDPVFDALVQGSKVRTVGDLVMNARQPVGTTQPDICLLVMRRAKSWDAGERGSSAWEGYFIPKANVRPLGPNVQQRTDSAYRYSFNASMSDRYPFGATFTEAEDGTTSAPVIDVSGDYPIHLVPYQGDGSETVFNLAYTPVSAAKVYIYVDGVKQVLTTDYTISGKVVTFLSAPADASRILAMYEVESSELG